ncbi:hypothetical protein GpartN1_g5714.t1 [Galdieria partita]|uniref:Uncharacterized protein n=1 Tax=Galdieria partita TaxID=83374 RepID=A0A9C7Q011_9RHOD|nr:hypothetical protein GpartN1_g5714.t1 [Galdieria partita]
MGSENTSRETKTKNDPKGDLAAKLASLPYSFSQTLPSVTRKKNNSYFDRNFPQLDSGNHSSKGNQVVAEQRSFDKHTAVKETQEGRGQCITGPTVAEIVAGVAHTSKPESHLESENKEELKESYSIEQVEKTLYSRLVPATNSSKATPRRLGTSVTSQFSAVANSNFPRKKQSTTSLPRPSKKDTLETNGERGNTVTLRHTFQQEPSVDRKSVNALQTDEDSRKKSWNVLKSNKMNRSHSANAVVDETVKDSLESQWMGTKDTVVDKRTELSSTNGESDSMKVEHFMGNEDAVHNTHVKSSETAGTTWKTGERQFHNSNDDYDKFESLLRSMGWNPENGEHGEEITEEEKAQWLEMHSGISTSSVGTFLSGNSGRYSNKLTCFSTSVVAVNALQAAHLRRDDKSFTDSEEEVSSSEYED